jgi:hypothetical protein
MISMEKLPKSNFLFPCKQQWKSKKTYASMSANNKQFEKLLETV